MSSDWQPRRTPRFGIALIPPRHAPAETDAILQLAGPPSAGPSHHGAGSSTNHLAVSSSGGWTAVAASASVPVSIAVVASHSEQLWPEKWLHPNERLHIARLLPPSRRESLAVLTAARRALAGAWHMPEPALARFDLSPLLDGVQSLRLGDWTVQRVPAPSGIHAAVAAPGAGWTYSLLQQQMVSVSLQT